MVGIEGNSAYLDAHPVKLETKICDVVTCSGKPEERAGDLVAHWGVAAIPMWERALASGSCKVGWAEVSVWALDMYRRMKI